MDSFKLCCIHDFLLPASVGHWCGVVVHLQRRPHVPRIKPLGPLVLYKIHQGIVDILVLPPHVELNNSTPKNTWTCGVRVWSHFEKVAKYSDRWGDAKESFTEINKDRKMQDGVRVQMIQGYAIIVQKPVQKRTCWQP